MLCNAVMTVTIRAHFDGKVIVPDETVSLPRDTPLTVHVETPVGLSGSEDGRRAAYDAFLARARAPGPASFGSGTAA